MYPSDLTRIELELGIVLPEVYRRAVLNFPIPACRGNSDTELWDDPTALIEYNRSLREGIDCVKPAWPETMFALGHGGDGSPVAINLSEPSLPVWWVEKCGLENIGTCQTHASFVDWLNTYVADVRHDLECNGIDPDGTPEARAKVEDANNRIGRSCFLVLIGTVAAILGLVGALVIWDWLRD